MPKDELINKISLKSTDVQVIFGKRGSGKTILGKYLVSKYKRMFIYDCLGEFAQFGKVVTNLDQINLDEDNCVVFNPVETEDSQDTHDMCALFVWQYMPNCLFVSDELHMYQGNSLSPAFKRLITQGRHRGIGMLGISQRYANLNQTIITQSSHVFMFDLMGRDVEVSKQYFGKKIEELFNNLPEYHFLYYNSKNKDILVMPPLSKQVLAKFDKTDYQSNKPYEIK